MRPTFSENVQTSEQITTKKHIHSEFDMGKAHSILDSVRCFKKVYISKRKSDIPDWVLECSNSEVCRPTKM